MPGSVTIRRPEGRVHGRIALPTSKSVANRALILASLSGDLASVEHPGDADDSRILHQLLQERPYRMHCGDGGTTFRFLLAWACCQEGEAHEITGNPHLLARPHGPLVDALLTLGADIHATKDGFRVRGKRMAGGTVHLDSPRSSQFISALLLVAPCFTDGLQLEWTGTRLSEPYVRMTVDLLLRHGAVARMEGAGIRVEPGGLHAVSDRLPPDLSAAAFWYETVALAAEARIHLVGVGPEDLQGDAAAAGLFAGIVRAAYVDGGTELTSGGDVPSPGPIDLIDTPDLFQPLVFTYAALGRSAVFTGLHNLPLKETDRLQAVAEALESLGCAVRYGEGRFTLDGRITRPCPPPFDPRGDHRMAMSVAPLALVCDAITVLHPEVVTKSYPGFWSDLRSLGFSVRTD